MAGTCDSNHKKCQIWRIRNKNIHYSDGWKCADLEASNKFYLLHISFKAAYQFRTRLNQCNIWLRSFWQSGPHLPRRRTEIARRRVPLAPLGICPPLFPPGVATPANYRRTRRVDASTHTVPLSPSSTDARHPVFWDIWERATLFLGITISQNLAIYRSRSE